MKSNILTDKIPAHYPKNFFADFSLNRLEDYKNIEIVHVYNFFPDEGTDSGCQIHYQNMNDFYGIKFPYSKKGAYKAFIRQYYAWERGLAPRPYAVLKDEVGDYAILTEHAQVFYEENFPMNVAFARQFYKLRTLKDPFSNRFYGYDVIGNSANYGKLKGKFVFVDFQDEMFHSCEPTLIEILEELAKYSEIFTDCESRDRKRILRTLIEEAQKTA